jgi:nicotinate-nucleotide pyrophosphorylase (carboxylating)
MKQIVALALQEDLGSKGDITSRAIFGPEDPGAARVICREACVVSGMPAAAEVCFQVDPELKFLQLVQDGQQIPAGVEVARLDGRLVSILAAERTLLNFISRLSGIATLTAGYVDAVRDTGARIAATRKTSPGLRRLEKQAVVDGGGELHRIGLYDAVLIKDNHLAAAGGVGDAVDAVRQALGPDIEVEVEVETAAEMEEAIVAGADRVLLDNMEPEEVGGCVRLAAGRLVIEASGGINLENVQAYAAAGANILSVGALTRSAPGMDFSLEIVAGVSEK